MTLYIDVRYSFQTLKTTGTYNGGNEYTRNIIGQIVENKRTNDNIVLLCDMGLGNRIKEEFGHYEVELKEIESLRQLSVTPSSKLFIPHVRDDSSYVSEIRSFRMNNTKTKIVMTVHDRRHMQTSYNKYAGVMARGIKSNALLYWAGKK